MDNQMPTTTLTEALAAGRIVEMCRLENAAHLSNARQIPYAEIYRERSGLIETPIERIQRAAEDEAKRAEKARQ
jgi:hypothetical protein